MLTGGSLQGQGLSSLHRFCPHACRIILRTHQSAQCTPPTNNQKLIDGSNMKTKKKHHLHMKIAVKSECVITGLDRIAWIGPDRT